MCCLHYLGATQPSLTRTYAPSLCNHHCDLIEIHVRKFIYTLLSSLNIISHSMHSLFSHAAVAPSAGVASHGVRVWQRAPAGFSPAAVACCCSGTNPRRTDAAVSRHTPGSPPCIRTALAPSAIAIYAAESSLADDDDAKSNVSFSPATPKYLASASDATAATHGRSLLYT